MAIRSFVDPAVQTFFEAGKLQKGIGWINVASIVRRKLDMIHYANRLDDLRAPPGNRLEALKGDRDGSHSIRVNDQWRVVFRWSHGGAEGVEVCDYHK